MERRLLTLRDLRSLVPSDVFHRGLAYFEEGAVHNLRRQQDLISADILGSALYRTTLALVPPFRSSCSCPYEGVCKHVVALGLAWLEDQTEAEDEEAGRAAVAPTRSLLERLQDLDAPALAGLVLRLYDELPDTRRVIEGVILREELAAFAEAPQGSAYQECLADVTLFLDHLLELGQVRYLLEESEERWGEGGDAANETLLLIGFALDDLIEAADELPDSATGLAVEVLDRVLTRLIEVSGLEDFPMPWWEEGERAAIALARRLAGMPEDVAFALRERYIPPYTEGAGFLEPILLVGEGDERATRRLAELLARTRTRMGVMAALRLLLRDGHVAEAVATAEAAQDNTDALLLVARALRARAGFPLRDQRSEGEFPEDLPPGPPDPTLLPQVIALYRRAIDAAYPYMAEAMAKEFAALLEAAGEAEEALQLRRQVFMRYPSSASWQELAALAGRLGRREAVVEEMLSWLRNTLPERGLLCEVLVAEADSPERFAEAAMLLRAQRRHDLVLPLVAKARALTAREREEAVDLIRWAAEALALEGGERAYGLAAKLLHALLETDPRGAPSFILAYADRHRRRRNLLAALRRVGVLR